MFTNIKYLQLRNQNVKVHLVHLNLNIQASILINYILNNAILLANLMYYAIKNE